MQLKWSAFITTGIVLATFVVAAARVHERHQLFEAAEPAPAPPRALPTRPPRNLPPLVASRAFSDLFGVDTDRTTAATGPNERSTLWHQQAFHLDGAPAQAVFVKTQPLDDEGHPLAHRLEAPTISAVVYRFAAGEWKLAGATRDFARIGAWGAAPHPNAPVQVLPFASGTVAFLFEQTDAGRGYTQVGKSVWAFTGSDWRDLGFVQTGGDNAGAADDTEGPYRFSGSIRMADDRRSYPDLLVTRRGTMRDADDSLVPATDTRYVFTGRGYEEVPPRR